MHPAGLHALQDPALRRGGPASRPARGPVRPTRTGCVCRYAQGGGAQTADHPRIRHLSSAGDRPGRLHPDPGAGEVPRSSHARLVQRPAPQGEAVSHRHWFPGGRARHRWFGRRRGVDERRRFGLRFPPPEGSGPRRRGRRLRVGAVAGPARFSGDRDPTQRATAAGPFPGGRRGGNCGPAGGGIGDHHRYPSGEGGADPARVPRGLYPRGSAPYDPHAPSGQCPGPGAEHDGTRSCRRRGPHPPRGPRGDQSLAADLAAAYLRGRGIAADRPKSCTSPSSRGNSRPATPRG